MTSDEIFLLTQRLRANPTSLQQARNHLASLATCPEYLVWQHSPAQAHPFELPSTVDAELLQALGLAQERRLRVRVNLHESRVFLTDGAWVSPEFRVFPYHDESTVLSRTADRLGWTQAADLVLDLAGGCGHTAWALNRPTQVMLDINPRALAYAELNRVLNELDSHRYLHGLNDIRLGIPTALMTRGESSVLVMANMPFAPAPNAGSLPLTTNGGRAGMDLQVATFKALLRLRTELPHTVKLRALVLGLTVGDAANDDWELVRTARAMFGAASVRWDGLSDQLLARVAGVRAMPNPSPAMTALEAVAACPLFTPDPSHRPTKQAAFRELAKEHIAAGNPDLAYGLVAVEL